MEKRRILNIFREFHGAGAWSARVLGVSNSTVSHWLHGTKSSARLDAAMPALAEELVRTNGDCINDINGKSVRSKIGRMRRGKK